MSSSSATSSMKKKNSKQHSEHSSSSSKGNKHRNNNNSHDYIFTDVDVDENSVDLMQTTPTLPIVKSSDQLQVLPSGDLTVPVTSSTNSTTTTTSGATTQPDVADEEDDDHDRPSITVTTPSGKGESTTSTTTTTTGDDNQHKDDLSKNQSNMLSNETEEVIVSPVQTERNPFNLENRESHQLYTTKILERQKSLENVPPTYSPDKQLYTKRHAFIKKIVNKVYYTLKSAASEDLLSSQKNQILKELFRNVTAELDDSVLEYLQNRSSGKTGSNQKELPFSPLHLSDADHHPSNMPGSPLPQMSLVNEFSNSPINDVKLAQMHNIDHLTHSYPILDDKDKPVKYYYQLISQYFYNVPGEVERFRPLLHCLWNNHWCILTFSSLFYLWLMEYRLSLIPQVNVFIKSTNKLFWHDLDFNTQKFKDIYFTLKQKLLDNSIWIGLNETTDSNDQGLMIRNRRLWIDFYHIITVFYFHYEDNVDKSDLDAFRQQMDVQYKKNIANRFDIAHDGSGNNISSSSSSSKGDDQNQLSIDDIFVRGILRQLCLIKTEDVLIKYIECCTLFKDWNLNAVSKIKLQSCLYSFSKPGSPLHLPRGVRVASRQTLDTLFPEGKVSRYTVNLFFRLLHPYYSTSSIVHWVVETAKQYFPSFLLK
ncbi:hypothetical protein SAMD00019534_117320 [Acytostelium subglobosum LB1]|uniref:hypothetical protein n=1 Tax=Acytostelium subglobosum LB1 TaxID=1410327 RepID=UPI000644AA46|nr:hypothetical protein SAMD00019534_117320 [Acytostelium subglobosum LB1]GAM28556.1 hypothetical protein SAMD00019534_117320 [Acytostelium subglobosum LB1]|eukprot:XP_012748595.1 hypothetical protein SAMD00019534_117320 [Acytostelium subglobosum LB1]